MKCFKTLNEKTSMTAIFVPFQFSEDAVGVLRELPLHVELQHLVQGFGVLELSQEVVVPRLFHRLFLLHYHVVGRRRIEGSKLKLEIEAFLSSNCVY